MKQKQTQICFICASICVFLEGKLLQIYFQTECLAIPFPLVQTVCLQPKKCSLHYLTKSCISASGLLHAATNSFGRPPGDWQ